MTGRPTTMDGILDAAAQEIETRGLWKGWYSGPTNVGHSTTHGPLCALGAIHFAATGDPMPGHGGIAYTVANEFGAWLRVRVGVEMVADWSDADGRTAAEVAAQMRACAEDWRQRHG